MVAPSQGHRARRKQHGQVGPQLSSRGHRSRDHVPSEHLDRRSPQEGPAHHGQGARRARQGPPGPRAHRLRRRAVVRQYRLRPQGDGRGRQEGDREPRLLPHLRRRLERADHPPGRARAGPVPRQGRRAPPLQGVLRLGRLGRQRHQLQAGPLLQQPARQAREEEDHLAARRLSRPDLRGRQPHRHPRLSQGLRPAGAGRAAHLLPALLPLLGQGRERGRLHQPHGRRGRGPDRQGGRRDGRRLHRRADHGHRRRADAAQGLLREAAEGLRQARHPVHRRRGHHRLRAHRPLVRDRRHEAQARHRHPGQGHHVRLLPGVGFA